MKPSLLALLLLALVGITTELSTHSLLRARIKGQAGAHGQSAAEQESSGLQQRVTESSGSSHSATAASASQASAASEGANHEGSKHKHRHQHSSPSSDSDAEHAHASLLPLKLPKAQPRFFAERLPFWARQLPVFPFDPFGQQYPGSYPILQQYLLAVHRAALAYGGYPRQPLAYPPGVVSPSAATGLSTFAYDGLASAPFRSVWDNTINPSLQFDFLDPFTFPLPGSLGGLSPPVSYSDYIPLTKLIGTGKGGKAGGGSGSASTAGSGSS